MPLARSWPKAASEAIREYGSDVASAKARVLVLGSHLTGLGDGREEVGRTDDVVDEDLA